MCLGNFFLFLFLQMAWMKHLSRQDLDENWNLFLNIREQQAKANKTEKVFKMRSFGTIVLNTAQVSDVPVTYHTDGETPPACAKVLLTTRWSEGRCVFPGGNADVTDGSAHGTFVRELGEEVGYDLPERDDWYADYVYSCDWNSQHKCYTCHVFARHFKGPKAGAPSEEDLYLAFSNRSVMYRSETCGLSFFEARAEMEKSNDLLIHRLPMHYIYAFDTLGRGVPNATRPVNYVRSQTPDKATQMRMQYVLVLVFHGLLTKKTFKILIKAIYQNFEPDLVGPLAMSSLEWHYLWYAAHILF